MTEKNTLNPTPFPAASILGYPRIGRRRELKKAVEAYWAGKISADELVKAAADVRKTSWTSLKERGVDLIPRYAYMRPPRSS